jgi:hypothetical protein
VFRTGFATVLVLLGCLLAGPAVAAYLLVDEVTDRQQYLDAVSPLADDAAVRTAVADQISGALDDKVPPQAQQLVDTSVKNFVQSGDFKPAWVKLNAEVHPQLLALLRGEKGDLEVQGDAVVLNLGVLADDLRSRFEADGVPLANRIPAVNAKVEVVSGPAVREAVPAFDLLEKLSVVLPVAAIVLIVGGVALSARRGVTLVVTGIGLVVSMLLVVLLQSLARNEVADRSPSPQIAGSFYDALTSRLSVVLWIVCGVGGVLVIVGAIIARRSSAARATASRAEPAYW